MNHHIVNIPDIGFDAVFLSYGNCGPYMWDGNLISTEMSFAIAEYLYQGGNLYVESGTFFNEHSYFGYNNITELYDLFGVDTAEFLTSSNAISILSGLDGSICNGLIFEDSDQDPVSFINAMTPDDNGVAAFEEDGYGVVAVQAEGDYLQKTFIFSYALSHLEDEDFPSTRYELLRRIIHDFFGVFPIGIEYYTIEGITISVHPNPFTTSTILSYCLYEPSTVTLSIFNSQGKLVGNKKQEQPGGKQQLIWNAAGLPAGMYYFRIQAGDKVGGGKMLLIR